MLHGRHLTKLWAAESKSISNKNITFSWVTAFLMCGVGNIVLLRILNCFLQYLAVNK